MEQVNSLIPSKEENKFDWKSADAYLFDIDGTLLVSRDHVHYNALNRAMQEAYGVETTIAGIAYHGKTDLGILRAALERVGVSAAAFEANLPKALEAVRRDVANNADAIKPQICAGIPEILAALKATGKLLGLASGNLEDVGWRKVRAAGLANHFSFGSFSDRFEFRADVFREGLAEARRRLGKNAEVCFVGDTPEDIKAARIAGARVIAVCTGIFKADELTGLKPDLCVACCSELLSR
jgi:phosphoglycolate phosphatase-like HAD superfamily hydrolase